MEVAQHSAYRHRGYETEIELAIVHLSLGQHLDPASVFRSVPDGDKQYGTRQAGLAPEGVKAVQPHHGWAVGGQRPQCREHIPSVAAQPARHATGALVGLRVEAKSGDAGKVNHALLLGALLGVVEVLAHD